MFLLGYGGQQLRGLPLLIQIITEGRKGKERETNGEKE